MPVPHFCSATWNFFHLLRVYLETEKVREGALGLRAVPELFPKTVSFQTIKKVEEWPISPNGQTLTTDVISRDHSPFHTLSFQSCLHAVLFSFSFLFSWITLTQTLGLRLEIFPVGALPPPSPVWARYFFPMCPLSHSTAQHSSHHVDWIPH